MGAVVEYEGSVGRLGIPKVPLEGTFMLPSNLMEAMLLGTGTPETPRSRDRSPV